MRIQPRVPDGQSGVGEVVSKPKPSKLNPVVTPVIAAPKKDAKLAGVKRRQILPFVSVLVVSPTGKRRMEKRPKV